MSDKELTIDGLKKLWNVLLRLERDQFMDCVNDARELLEQSEPVRHGHWQMTIPSYVYECSSCGQYVNTADICVYKFCHHCGAKMDEVTP